MEFTGERYISSLNSAQISYEHWHRYFYATQFVKGKKVLDIACGEGYGVNLLGETAEVVVGVDISEATIDLAKQRYQKKNISFLHGSADDIPIEGNNRFDVVVSFETIEHLDAMAQEGFLKEVKRLLKNDGILIISSPNKLVYSDIPKYKNEFHIKEFYENEFFDFLHQYFVHVSLFGQKVFTGSNIWELDSSEHDNSFIEYKIDNRGQRFVEDGEKKEAVYLVAVCSDIKQVHSKHSLLLDRSLSLLSEKTGELDKIIFERDQLIRHHQKEIEKFGAWDRGHSKVSLECDKSIISLNQSLFEKDNEIAVFKKKIDELNEKISSHNYLVADLREQITRLNDETIKRGKWALGLQDELKEAQDQIIRITKTISWRITLPLRKCSLWVRGLSSEIRKILIRILKLLKTIYLSLPFSWQTRYRHINFLNKYAPWMLRILKNEDATSPVFLPNGRQTAKINFNFEFKDIKFKSFLEPIVSIIIPVYGQLDYTLRCLASISKNTSTTPFEIIVVDDCSQDNSAKTFQGIDGIRLIVNKDNQGFIRSCNVGAKAAIGKYLHFLNNDTVVSAGWLDELVRTFSEFNGTGLVGSQLVYPSGKLQEAGSIIWQDGSAWNFGRNQDPELPVFNYAREVDYCSGASIMLPKNLFEKLGGFDEQYMPAYCEDSDLALKVRENGYRVIYQPLSKVFHFEGVTCGTDISDGIKAFQAENRKKLYSRWKNRLKTHQLPGTNADIAKDRQAKSRVLVLDHCTPTPDQDAGSVTIFNLMLLFREMGFQVTFIPEDNYLYMPIYTTALQRAGIEVLYAPYVSSVEKHVKECGQRYDLVFLSRPLVVERNINTIRRHCIKAKVIYYTHDLHFLRMHREADLFKDNAKRQAAYRMKQLEFNAIRMSDTTIAVTEKELEFLRKEFPEKNISVLTLVLNIGKTDKKFSDRHDIIFVGGYQHAPNVDAVKYFVSEVMPLLRTRLPGVRFNIVGSNPPNEIQLLAAEDIIISGFVKNLNPLLDKMRVSVAPLRFGAGIKGKIGTAMAAGLPVVATSVAAEGMALSDGKNILIADGAEPFADAIKKIYTDEILWNRISDNGVQFAECLWGAQAGSRALSRILLNLGFDPGIKYGLPKLYAGTLAVF